jgi:hypothetical protein
MEKKTDIEYSSKGGKRIKDSNNYDKELDKFYTNPDVVDKVIGILKELFEKYNLNINEFNFIEPSAGSGAFVEGIKRNFDNPNIKAYDIDPEGENIEKADFLAITPIYSNKNIIIGNPPFGYKGSLAADFINKSSEWAPIIAFVLPIQYRRYNIQKRIYDNLKIVKSTKNLPKNSFTLSGAPYNVNCLIQIWVDKFSGYFLDEEDLRLYKPLPNKHEDFKLFIHNNTVGTLKYFNKDEYKWDFAVARQGYYDYNNKITNPEELQEHVQYLFVKYESEISKKIFEKIDFEKLSKVNTSIPGFSNTDLVKEYVKVKNELKNKM